jgi:hypothetical protein
MKIQDIIEAHGNSKIYDKCWTGYKKVPGKKRGEEGSCEKIGEGLNEMDKSAPQPGRDGKVSHSTYGSRDKKGSDYFKGKEAPGKPITKKEMEKYALDILKKQGVAEGGFKNKTAVFSGYSNYMRSRAPNVFKQLDIKVLNKEYFEDEDIIEYTVISDGDSLAKARATLETNPQFGGMVLKKIATESIDADQKKARQVPATEMPKKTSPVLGKAPKQHPFKGRAVGGGL